MRAGAHQQSRPVPDNIHAGKRHLHRIAMWAALLLTALSYCQFHAIMDRSQTRYPVSQSADLARGESASDDVGIMGSANHSAQDAVATATASEDVSQPSLKLPSAARTNQVLQTLYGPIIDQLAEVEARIQQEMQSPYEDVAVLLRHGIQLGGKRLRPAIHLLMARALEQHGDLGQPNRDSGANVVIGVVLEMIHTATLVHDDVLDQAETRRHVPTINAQWDEHTSILLGDYLFAQSYRLAATLENTRTCRWVGEAARLVCQGELRQVLQRDQLELDRETYYEIIRGKTAELCRVACSLAAAEVGCDDEMIDQVAEYGDALGIAFQIADDYLDLWGQDDAVGKTLGTDLQQGKMTLPVIRLLETLSETDRNTVIGILQGPADERVEAILPWLNRSDAKAFTQQVANDFKEKALQALQPLVDSPAKASLIQIAEFSVQRPF